MKVNWIDGEVENKWLLIVINRHMNREEKRKVNRKCKV